MIYGLRLFYCIKDEYPESKVTLYFVWQREWFARFRLKYRWMGKKTTDLTIIA